MFQDDDIGVMPQGADLQERDRLARTWIDDPHRFFKAFSRTARRFQHAHRSARLSVRTLVGKPDEFLKFKPRLVHLLGRTVPVHSWEEVLSAVVMIVVAERPACVRELGQAGLVPWMAPADPSAELLESFGRGEVTLRLTSREEAFRSAQWLVLMAGVRLNEALVQVDAFTNESWKAREAQLQAKHAEEKRILQEIDQAREQYAADHPDELPPAPTHGASYF